MCPFVMLCKKTRPVVDTPQGIEAVIAELIPFVMSIADNAVSYMALGALAICGLFVAVVDAVKIKLR